MKEINGVKVYGKKAPSLGAWLYAQCTVAKVELRLERAGMKNCAPKFNPEKDNKKPKGETVPYEQFLRAWKEGRVK